MAPRTAAWGRPARPLAPPGASVRSLAEFSFSPSPRRQAAFVAALSAGGVREVAKPPQRLLGWLLMGESGWRELPGSFSGVLVVDDEAGTTTVLGASRANLRGLAGPSSVRCTDQTRTVQSSEHVAS
eukprot:scaffold279177_cov33-Prasinocladus_malaysianus.AAC.2